MSSCALGDTLNLINGMNPILLLAGSWPLLFKLPNFDWVVGYFPHIYFGMTSIILRQGITLSSWGEHLSSQVPGETSSGHLIAAPVGLFVLRRKFQSMESLQKLHPAL